MNKEYIKGLDLVMYMSPECQWCNKMVTLLISEDLINYVTIVNINKTDFKFRPGQVIPLFVSPKLSTVSTGYTSIEQLIKNLKTGVTTTIERGFTEMEID